MKGERPTPPDVSPEQREVRFEDWVTGVSSDVPEMLGSEKVVDVDEWHAKTVLPMGQCLQSILMTISMTSRDGRSTAGYLGKTN